MQTLGDILKALVAIIGPLLGLAPKVVDAAKAEELGPPPPEADKDALVKDLETERQKKFGPK